MLKKLLQIASPPIFFSVASKAYIGFGVLGLLLFILSIAYALISTPIDAQQGLVTTAAIELPIAIPICPKPNSNANK